jgi:hypothetical protein
MTTLLPSQIQTGALFLKECFQMTQGVKPSRLRGEAAWNIKKVLRLCEHRSICMSSRNKVVGK